MKKSQKLFVERVQIYLKNLCNLNNKRSFILMTNCVFLMKYKRIYVKIYGENLSWFLDQVSKHKKASKLVVTTVYLNSVANETLNLQFFVVIGESYGEKGKEARGQVIGQILMCIPVISLVFSNEIGNFFSKKAIQGLMQDR